ncbi:MAG TPA: hypothetical protein VFM42_02245 [Sphingomicrobium sp.]|nr:hypothetical protein [Sphingomicrobium sp.]
MRKSLIVLPLLLASTPALSQPAASPAPPAAPPQLFTPQTAGRLTDGMQALSDTLLNLKVGGVKAALEGREATPQEEQLTLRDLARAQDPDFDKQVEQQIAQARPMIRRSVKAVGEALPQMMQGLEQMQKSLERAAANMPDPNYPKR